MTPPPLGTCSTAGSTRRRRASLYLLARGAAAGVERLRITDPQRHSAIGLRTGHRVCARNRRLRRHLGIIPNPSVTGSRRDACRDPRLLPLLFAEAVWTNNDRRYAASSQVFALLSRMGGWRDCAICARHHQQQHCGSNAMSDDPVHTGKPSGRDGANPVKSIFAENRASR